MPKKRPAAKKRIVQTDDDKNLVCLIFISIAFLCFALGAIATVNSLEWMILGIVGIIFLFGALLNHFSYKK
jgi:hypothetical protein